MHTFYFVGRHFKIRLKIIRKDVFECLIERFLPVTTYVEGRKFMVTEVF